VLVTNTQSFLQQARKYGEAGGEGSRKIFVSLEKAKNHWTYFKNCTPLRKLFAPLVSQAAYEPILSQAPPKLSVTRNYIPAGPLSHRPWASNPNSELRVKPYRDTGQLCLFLKHSHTAALICNVASHNSNK